MGACQSFLTATHSLWLSCHWSLAHYPQCRNHKNKIIVNNVLFGHQCQYQCRVFCTVVFCPEPVSCDMPMFTYFIVLQTDASVCIQVKGLAGQSGHHLTLSVFYKSWLSNSLYLFINVPKGIRNNNLQVVYSLNFLALPFRELGR